VADTDAVADELQADFGLSSDSVTVVPLGVSMPEPDIPLVRPKPYLLTVATLEPRKNLARLAEAYARSGISASHDLVVVGRVGWGDPPAGVEIVSGLDDLGLAAAYAGATALVLPSIYEGFGLPVVEAMQLGVPVVCSDIPVLREVSGGHATLVDPTDLESLIEGLRASLTLSAPAGAADWARKTWRWERTVSALSALYRKLDRGRRY
jgi:glycosyltransferase involved in cell wall biosynthesis